MGNGEWGRANRSPAPAHGRAPSNGTLFAIPYSLFPVPVLQPFATNAFSILSRSDPAAFCDAASSAGSGWSA
jgi:hypothetical protein